MTNLSFDYCCEVMKYAVEENYLYNPIQMIDEIIDDKRSISLKVMAPAIMGEKLSKRGRKNKPSMVLSLCPWCGKKYE